MPILPPSVLPPSTRRSRWARPLLGLGLAALLMACGAKEPQTPPLSLEQARAELDAGRAVLIDIREPEEHARGVAPGARLLPLSQIDQRLAELPSDPNTPVLLICNTQNRSKALLAELEARGFRHVRYVSGGMSAWTERAWPLVPPPR